MRVTAILKTSFLSLGLTFAAESVMAEPVKVTPLGSHDGEFCRFDRAMIFEDPDGTRILYDAGRTVAGVKDPRLGKIDGILVSHMHGDHVGDKHIPSVNAGSCSEPDLSTSSLPDTLAVQIAIDQKAEIITGSEMPSFFANKLKKLGGDPKKSKLVRFGASYKLGGVTITTVPAVHSNGIHPGMIGGEIGKHLEEAGLTAYAGPPTGYVLTFSNGLSTYLSGDTGVTAEQKIVVADQYKTKLVVMNIGDTFTTGPTEAAYVINELIKPTSVIASHANETATEKAKLLDNTRTKAFKETSNVPVYLPLSGQTMSFDEKGTCVSGCS